MQASQNRHGHYLMCFPFAAATVMYALFPETSGCELEQIAPEA
jgi:hypothetical protein